MAPDPSVTTVHRSAFRYSNYDTPFWVSENSQAGRWHQPGDGPTQYLSLSPSGAWAELIRHEGLTTEDDVAEVRMQIWVARIEEGHLADYADFARAEAAAFDPEALVDEDYSRCQAEGRRLRREGFRGIIAPSAALPGVANITLFGARYSIQWGTRRVLASAVPAAVAAVGAPPPGLVARVRQHGAEHEGLLQYRMVKAPVRARRSRRKSE